MNTWEVEGPPTLEDYLRSGVFEERCLKLEEVTDAALADGEVLPNEETAAVLHLPCAVTIPLPGATAAQKGDH
jgi:hypothetical protein